tara:strand:- start:684 stop:1109 length:426 start_codon:yes stop_codon:yes gene_type:complete
MSTKKPIGQNMMLVSSSFRGVKSFNMIAVAEDCPYVEAMFDPASGIIVVISKNKKQTFTMLPRLNENGEQQKLKFPNKETGKVIKEQRVMVETFSEFYITEKEDIENFIEIFAINAGSFDYKDFMNVDAKETKTSNIIMPT